MSFMLHFFYVLLVDINLSSKSMVNMLAYLLVLVFVDIAESLTAKFLF